MDPRHRTKGILYKIHDQDRGIGVADIDFPLISGDPIGFVNDGIFSLPPVTNFAKAELWGSTSSEPENDLRY